MEQYQREEIIVKLDNVSLKFKREDNSEVTVLRDINLEMDNITRSSCTQGQIVSILAPSGIGKTQLLKILAKLNTPTTGSVLMGHPLKEVKLGEVGLVQQTYTLFDDLKVYQNLLVELYGCHYKLKQNL